MRKFLPAILLIAIAGVGASLYLIPTDEEVTTLRQKDEVRGDNGVVDYRGRYASGERTAPVLIGMSDVMISEGRGEEIQPELETFLEKEPQAIGVRKKLAEIYRLTGRDQDYLKQIEMVAEQEPNEGNLKLLADMYNYVQRYDQQAKALRRLIEVTNGTKPEYYADLAMILATQEKRGEAAGVVQELKSAHPNYMSFKLVQLLVGASVDSGDMDAAFQEASSWVSREPKPEEIAILSDRLTYGGRPDMALQLMTPHREAVTTSETLYVSYVNALMNDDQEKQAYKLMLASHQEKKLPNPLYRPLIQLALQRGETELAEEIVSELSRENFSEDDAINLLELAEINDSDVILSQLVALFDVESYAIDKPALVAIIGLIRRDMDEDAKIQAALENELSPTATLRLAQACARNGKETCFDTLVAQFPALSEMSPREVNEMADLYIAVDRQSEIIDDVRSLSEASDSEQIELAYIKLAASKGDRETLINWLNRDGRTASTTTLSQLFYLANDRGHGKAAAEIAAVLYDRDPNETHRDYVISSYIRAGLEAKALPLIRQAASESRAMEDNYLAALTKLGKADATYREELRQYVIPQLNSEEVESGRKLQLIYALINTGHRQQAMPYIKEHAKAEGGEWSTLLDQINGVGGTSKPAPTPITERSREFRVALARDPQTDEKTKRMLAFSLMDDGFRDEATDIFFELAQTANPGSQEMEDLLYLWGPRLNEEQIGWLSLRARNAENAGDTVRWGELISQYGDDFALMDYVTNNPDALAHPSVRKRYFAAMGRYANEETYTAGLKSWVDATDSTEPLIDYADAAIAAGHPQAALYALKRVELIDPTNEKALKTLAILEHGRADYSEAQRYINQYAASIANKPQPETNTMDALFYQAEILRREGDMAQARQYYQQLIDLGPHMATDKTLRSQYYTSLFYLGRGSEGRQGFYALLEAYSGDKGILADFISVLLDVDANAEARAVANQYDQRSDDYQNAMQPMVIQSQHLSGIERFENGQEMRLQFDQPINDENLKMQGEQPAWIEGATRGYDSMLIEAEPGRQLQLIPLSSETTAIVPRNNAVMSPEERLSRQQDLRLQLLYARMELEEGNTQQALARVNQLKAVYPQDPQLMGYSANIENQAGNWQHALTLIEGAQQITPDNEDFALLRDEIERVYSEEVKIDHTYRRIGDSDEQITTLSGRVRPTHNTELGMVLQNNELDASGIRRSNTGNIEDFDISRQRAEIYGAYYFGNGDRLKGAIFANNDDAGAGAYYAFNNPAGRTELLAEYQRPYWDFVEAVSEEATRSRVGAKHLANLDERTTVSGEVSVNQYNTAIDHDAAKTALVRANIVRRIRDANPTVAVGYGFDGEYLIDEEKRFDAQGNYYRTFPIVDREIHYPSVIVSQDFNRGDTRAEVSGGWAYDRLGEDGPQVQGKLTHDVTKDVEAEVRAAYGLQTQDTSQNVTHVGGHLRYQF